MTLTFGKSTYEVADPPKSWNKAGVCTACLNRLLFVFLPKLDPSQGGFAGAYLNPVAVRCNCGAAPVPITCNHL